MTPLLSRFFSPLFLALALLIPLSGIAADSVSKEDIEDIHKTILEYYIGGGITANAETVKLGFHEKATMYGYANGQMTGGPIQQLFDLIAKSKPAKELKAEITRIDIVGGQIAQVKCESYNWGGARYTDMFQLIKEKGKWKIISKTYYTW